MYSHIQSMLYSILCIWLYTIYVLLTTTVACPSLSDPMSGNVTYDSDSILENRYTSGTEAVYSCSRGELFGNVMRNCQESGDWTGTDPSCSG